LLWLLVSTSTRRRSTKQSRPPYICIMRTTGETSFPSPLTPWRPQLTKLKKTRKLTSLPFTPPPIYRLEPKTRNNPWPLYVTFTFNEGVPEKTPLSTFMSPPTTHYQEQPWPLCHSDYQRGRPREDAPVHVHVLPSLFTSRNSPGLYIPFNSTLRASQRRRPYQRSCLSFITICGNDIKSISSRSWRLLMHFILRLPILVPQFPTAHLSVMPCAQNAPFTTLHLPHMTPHTPPVVSRKLGKENYCLNVKDRSSH
jgi:hypothetical protein